MKKDIKFTRIGNLEWSEDLGEMTWQEAIDKAKEIGARLPTRAELVDLYDNHSTKCQKLIKDSPSNTFWSLTEGSATAAWRVALGPGYTASYYKTASNQVRCVR